MGSQTHRAARKAALILALLASASLASTSAVAQYGPGPGGRAPYSYQGSPRDEAGNFAYYALVLSWSPTYCASLQRDRSDPQCDRRSARPYAFVLHGLWPQHEHGWPQDCRIGQRPYVPRSTIDRMLDIMPSPRLVIHEYRKHGTCSGLAPDAYFQLARDLFMNLNIPPRYVRPNQAFFVSPDELKGELVAANPGLPPDALSIGCGGPGARLREVRICLTREGQPRACGRNEHRRQCRQARMYVPPVRGGGGGVGDQDGSDRRDNAPLPGPLDNAPKGDRRI
jgi:ribonuclease T2